MPKNITKSNDYKGFTQLVISANSEDMFNEFVFEIEKIILSGNSINDFGLLGYKEYNDLINDLDINNLPTTQKYIDLINGKTYINNSGDEVNFLGLRKLLTYFVYSHWIVDNNFQESDLGTIQTLGENSIKTTVKQTNQIMYKRFNKGVDFYNGETYDYLLFNQNQFPNWNFTRQYKYITRGII